MSIAQVLLRALTRSGVPVPTPDLVALTACGIPHRRQQVWNTLRRLEKSGLVARIRPKKPKEPTRWLVRPPSPG